jgi:hypothetical protein
LNPWFRKDVFCFDDELALIGMVYGLNCVSDQVEQDLLDLGSVDESKRVPVCEIKGDFDAAILGSHEGKVSGLLDKPLKLLKSALAVASGHELAQVSDHVPSAQGLLARAREAFPKHRHLRPFHALEDAVAALVIVDDRR